MKKLLILIPCLFLGLSYSCKKGKNNSKACNGSSTRRDIKLVVDDNAMEVDTIPIVTTVDSIGSFSVPEADGDTDRQDVEKLTFQITAKVHKLSKHRDGDWKVKLVVGEEDDEKYVNCEAPNPGCSYAESSRFIDQFQLVHDWITKEEDNIVGKTVTVIGVAFIDIDHKYPRNAAENELELHPILDIYYE